MNITADEKFGGYCDWNYERFSPKVSLRFDCLSNFQNFSVGKSGLCIKCGAEISEGLYCNNCDHVCDDCGDHFSDEAFEVYDSDGRTINVCRDCFENNYSECADCGAYYPNNRLHIVGNENLVCDSCLNDYVRCNDCDRYYNREEVFVLNTGEYICEDCFWDGYGHCDDCCEAFCIDELHEVHGEDNDIRYVCMDCREIYYDCCDECGEYHHSSNIDPDGVCTNCAENHEDAAVV